MFSQSFTVKSKDTFKTNNNFSLKLLHMCLVTKMPEMNRECNHQLLLNKINMCQAKGLALTHNDDLLFKYFRLKQLAKE